MSTLPVLGLENAVDHDVARPPVETQVFKHEPEARSWAVVSEAWSLLRELRTSSKRWHLAVLAGALLCVLVANIYGQIWLNEWNGSFYRAIEHKDKAALWSETLSCLKIVLFLLTIVVSQTWLHSRLKISLREWLSHQLLDRWLGPGRAYRLSITSDSGVNPDQRIQEDVRNLSEASADLGVGLAQAALLLLSFIGVLWGMSEGIRLEWNGHPIQIPGYMVWAALIYAGIGSWMTNKVGQPLIKLNEERYAREADFRFSIVRVSESSENVAFYSGEQDERKIINESFKEVLKVTRESVGALARLTWVTSGYGWVMLILPALIALPGYLQGTLDLGGLMVVIGAFGQVQSQLRWFVDNFARIADWRAALHRVTVFRDAVDAVDDFENSERIQLIEHPEGHLQFDHAKVSLMDGEVVIADATAQIKPGERVLIMGPSGSGKSTLLRAVGGLWPWGSGTIYVPPREQVMFLPQKPYMPLGTLADAICYPHASLGRGLEEMAEALARVNLEEFIPMLEQNERWDKLMSLGQQQRLAFARLLLHKPKWIFLDEATSALDDANQGRMMGLLAEELKESAVLSIGHRHGLAEYHTRTLQLTMTDRGTVLRRPRRKKRVTLWKKAKSLIVRPAVTADAGAWV